MKKTILHITDELSVGGTEILLKNTLPLLPEYDHVLCYLGGDPVLINEFQGISIHCLEHNGKKDIYRSVKRLRELISKYKAEIVHSHLLWSSFIAKLAKPKNVKLVCTLHNIMSKDAFEKNRFALFAEKFTARKIDLLIGVSEYVVKDYLKYVPFKGATQVLHNFIPDHFFSTDSKMVKPKVDTSLNCVAIGNLKYQKNYTYLIEAFSHLKDRPFTLSVFGNGPEKETIADKIEADKLNIILKGVENKIEEVISEYDVFIQASHYEGYGIALVEAMAKGLVPVLSDIPVHREIAAEAAYYFDLTDSKSLSSLLQKLFDEKIILTTNRDAIIERAKMVGSAEKYKQKLNDIYNTLLQAT